LSSSDNPQTDPQLQPPLAAQSQPPGPDAPDGFPLTPYATDPSGIPSPTSTITPPPPPENPVFSGWDVLLIFLIIVLTIVVAETITLVVAKVFVYPGLSLQELTQKPALGLLGEVASYVVVAIYMVMLVEGKYHVRFLSAIGWNWRRGATLKLLGLGVLTVALDILGSRVLPMPKTTPFDQFFQRPQDAYLLAAFALTAGPLMEELFFRGFLYPVLARRMGVASAVVLTALPFGLIHYLQYKSWAAVLVIALVGVVLTLVRVVTKSVAASFLVHVGYNTTLMALTAIATDGFRHMEKAVAVPVCLILPRLPF
jgi:membrane protease YdiL (CAAX protease family)